MRRLIWTVLGLPLLMALVGPAESVAQEGRIVAVVLKVKNDVRQRPSGDVQWGPARKGQPLVAGHEVRTGEDSFCALVFQDDQSLLKITSNTEVTLKTEDAGAGRFSKRVWVGVGGIWAKVSQQEETSFEIETPTSVASVKGSSCYDMVNLSGWTTLFVLGGSFQFSNPFGQAFVNAGFTGFSNGVDPPVVAPTGRGEAPVFGEEGTTGGSGEGEGGLGEEGVRELRIGMRDEEGAEKSLVIRYREPENE